MMERSLRCADNGYLCRPSCKSRAPKAENVLIFQHVEEALARKFRPCKRCKPTGERVPDQEWIYGITDYIEHHYAEPLTLDVLATVSHGSPYHLHRVFKRITGRTPVQYIQDKRITEARKLLEHTGLTVTDIGRHVGIPNSAYFITVFRNTQVSHLHTTAKGMRTYEDKSYLQSTQNVTQQGDRVP